MKPLSRAFGAAAFFVASATSAQAAFGCDVLPLPEGVIELHKMPNAASPVIMLIPVGWNVSRMTEEGGIQGAWIRVAYASDPDAFWGEGVVGWVLGAQLDNCG